MINGSTIISYGILMVNDEERKDYYDNFVPIVAECIHQSSNEFVTVSSVQDDIKSIFGLTIPQNVINTILKRKLKPQGYLIYKNKTYTPNRERLVEFKFSEKRQNVLDKHEQLLNEMVQFALKKFGVEWEKSDAEEAFEEFIANNHLNMVETISMKKDIIETYQPGKSKLVYIVASFIKHIKDIHSPLLEHLLSIVKGDMLANSIYFTDPSHIDMKFKITEVYLDTSFLIYALGYAGEHRQAPCLELISLLKENGAITRCFKHTVDEIIGILEGCQYRLDQGNHVDNHGTMEYFIKNKYNRADIERLIYSVEREIENKLKIKVVDTPPYFEQYNIDEKGLTEYLQGQIRYPNQRALERDVSSISSIMQIRKGQSSMRIENCRAIFVTTNTALCQNVKTFFSNEVNSRLIPPIISDYVMTNLLWLKSPNQAPDLPRKRIIADCIASTMPQEYIWKRYMEKILELKEGHQITSEDYFLLRYSQESRAAMMDKTLGDEDVLTTASVEEILEITKDQMVQSYRTESEQMKETTEMVLKELEQIRKETAASLEQKAQNFRNLADKYAWKIIFSLKLFISILLSLGNLLANKIFELGLPTWALLLLTIIFFLVFPVAGMWGYGMNGPFSKLEKRLAEKRYKSLQRWYG